MKKFKNKETGEIENLEDIKKEYDDLIGNTLQFEEYKDDFPKFLNDFYIEVE